MVEIVGKDLSALREVTCKSCASRLRFMNSEICQGISRDYGGGVDVWYYITCPSCSNTVSVKKD